MSEQEPEYCETQLERILRELAAAFCARLGNARAWGKIEVCIQDGKAKSYNVTETRKTE